MSIVFCGKSSFVDRHYLQTVQGIRGKSEKKKAILKGLEMKNRGKRSFGLNFPKGGGDLATEPQRANVGLNDVPIVLLLKRRGERSNDCHRLRFKAIQKQTRGDSIERVSILFSSEFSFLQPRRK